jgi:hypothetical protein
MGNKRNGDIRGEVRAVIILAGRTMPALSLQLPGGLKGHRSKVSPDIPILSSFLLVGFVASSQSRPATSHQPIQKW